MSIDVSKLKKGDRYRSTKEGWVVVGWVLDIGDGKYRVTDDWGSGLAVFANGRDVDGDTRWDILEVDIKDQSAVIKSDGGSSGYYTFPKVLVDKVVSTEKLETQDIITHGFGNDFDFGNAFTSLKRLYEIKCGGGKEGNTPEYEVNKIKYSLDRILEGSK
jgi:hypothetical protein